MPTAIALVTGATEGNGRAIAKVEALLADLRKEGITAAGRAADVGNPESVRSLIQTITTELGPVDTLVNNAGIAIFRPFSELSLEDWDATMATNLRSLFLMTREVLPGMRERKSGAIVNVASLAGKNAIAGGTAYVASKHAVLGFSRSLMLEVRKEGIRVAQAILDALRMPVRALVSEIDIRPANP